MDKKKGTWVQTERKAHEQWADLIRVAPRSGQLMHILVANMDSRGALVVSQKTLAEMMGMSVDTVKRALKPLKEGNWIEVVRIGSQRGGANAYLVNRRVAWGDKRENQKFAAFDARVVISSKEQEPGALEKKEPLRKLPKSSEYQIPVGPGIDPPSQPFLEDHEPDLPATNGGDAEKQQELL